jgi:hypothetical protein
LNGEVYKFLTDLINNGRYMDWADEAHETWRRTKQSQGWRYGPDTDRTKKTNPNMVPFAELPATARGQNSLTPYAVVNFFRIYAAGKSLAELDEIFATVVEARNSALLERLGEYVHSHFLAAQLAKGETINTRSDMIVYEALDEDTKSWDTQSALEVIKFLRQEITR